MGKIVSMTLLAASLAGCSEVATVPLKTQWKESDYAAYTKVGTGAVTGEAFMRQRGGAVVTCAGSEVLLVPDEGIFSEIVQINESGKKVAPLKEKINTTAIKATKCDAQGKFSFQQIPAGMWIIQTNVKWETPGHVAQGSFLSRRFRLMYGEKTEIILSK